jgi:hypothetical protein
MQRRELFLGNGSMALKTGENDKKAVRDHKIPLEE